MAMKHNMAVIDSNALRMVQKLRLFKMCMKHVSVLCDSAIAGMGGLARCDQ
ncbi:MAG: hypothetical protein GX049_13570 [Alcaligenaceae bacterium]|nr:hypothetical protein [Alcaligenaceae bacterium]